MKTTSPSSPAQKIEHKNKEENQNERIWTLSVSTRMATKELGKTPLH
jgi:hypothetical protein